MATIEERVQALEQEHAELKKAMELQTVAIGALVSKTTLEKLIEQDDKLFDTLIAHDRLTNERFGHLQTQVIDLDGKIVGLQVETRQGFTELDGKIVGLQVETRQGFTELDGKIVGLQVETRQGFTELDGKIVGLQVETRQGFTELDGKIVGLQTEMRQRFEQQDTAMNARFDQMTLLLNALGPKPEQEK